LLCSLTADKVVDGRGVRVALGSGEMKLAL
jgi:hypothetical protein